MSMIYIVFDYDGNIFGVYDELLDANDRAEELNDVDHKPYFIEEYELNRDHNPEGFSIG